jgi:hypothetical protein
MSCFCGRAPEFVFVKMEEKRTRALSEEELFGRRAQRKKTEEEWRPMVAEGVILPNPGCRRLTAAAR